VPETLVALVALVALETAPLIKLPGIDPDDKVPTAVIPVYEPEILPDGKVPEVMFDAFVVSVVADVAKPETAPEEIAIDVAVTEVTLPKESTDIAGTADADPYVPADTPEVGSLADGTVPEDKLDAFNVLLAVLAVVNAKLA
jgi:hypothetical protein